MLGKQRAVEVMEGVGRALGSIVRPDAASLTPARLERLADAVVAVEYYMETLQAGRADQWPMLDAAAARLAEIEPASAKVLPWRDAAAPTEFQPDRTQRIVPPAPDVPGEPAAVPAAAATSALPTTVDPEFLQLFVEEARENADRLRALFPQWEQNPLDAEALRDLRRSFHTLKGSGRMVGARRVGEFSWSVESLLNRVISQTLARSPEIVAVVRDAVSAMPQLIDEIDGGPPASIDIAAIMARADALSGRDGPALPAPEAAAPAVTPAIAPLAEAQPAAEVSTIDAVPEPFVDAASDEPRMDPVLREIFRKETAGHILVVREYLERCSRGLAPHPVSDALYRACHTLSGIAKTAGARQGIKVAEPMEHYVRKLHDNGHGLDGPALGLLAETAQLLESISEHVDEDTGFFPEQGHLVAGWLALDRALDSELARLADAAERTLGDGWRPAHAEPEATAPIVPPVETVAPSWGAPASPSAADDLTEPSLPALAEDAEEFDADIAAIFGEEATELLEQAEAAFSRWRLDRADRSQVTELKRLLHTLKGGARMAGIRAMGDLSHEVESFLAAVEASGSRGDEATLDVLQASLDELHRMRELANSGLQIAQATDLIARIRVSEAAASQPLPTEPPAELPAAAPAVDESAVQIEATPVESQPIAAAEDEGIAPEPLSEQVVESILLGAEPEDTPIPVEGIEVIETPALEDVEDVEHIEVSTAESDWLIVEDAAAGEDIETDEPPTTVAPTPVAEAIPEPRFVAPATPVEPFEHAASTHTAPVLPGREPVAPAERAELARVDAELLDDLLNNAGEVSIFRARIEQQMTSIEFNLAELDRTVTRLREQLRKLEMETEAQILHRHQADEAVHRADFDPLELDRYSTIQQLSRALAESVSDVASIEGLLANLNRDTQNLLQQQGRVVTEVQNGLMRTRMVPFQRHVQRLTRIVRQAATESGRKAEFVVEGASGELDRQVLERMLPPFEHMLRNAVIHGIESPSQRLAAGKPETGRITMKLQREGAEVVIVVEDDGAGLNVPAIRAKARHMGLLGPEQDLTDEEALQLVLEPGFSTASRLTQSAGRGVGMDVVATEVKKLGGGLFIESKAGYGARFTIRLPFTLAITQALIVRVHDELFALPMATVEGVARLTRSDIQRHIEEEHPTFDYGGNVYRFQHLGTFVGSGPSALPETDAALPVILVRAGEHSTALVTDELLGSREIVVKPVGPQIASIRGISGATILGDGRIVVILDMGTLVRSEWRARSADGSRPIRDERIFALVVDDSITVRRVTQRLLERNGMRVMTAKDGIEALALLQEHVPDVILLDIEMPRMDGYEVATHVRSDARIADVPIIMITSRVGDKHRARAIEIGVDDYLGKPYQESQLLDAIEPLVLARRRMQG
jgi:chemosensory pili system protein ChpA (sensor histidine kinase/response regulator)